MPLISRYQKLYEEQEKHTYTVSQEPENPKPEWARDHTNLKFKETKSKTLL